jgi:hypothetical protein
MSMCLLQLFYLIILKLNNELSEDLPELYQMVNPYNFMSQLVPGNEFGFRTTLTQISDRQYRAS